MADPKSKEPTTLPETPELDEHLLKRSEKDPGANFTKRAREESTNTRSNETPQSVPGGPFGPGERNTQYERK